MGSSRHKFAYELSWPTSEDGLSGGGGHEKVMPVSDDFAALEQNVREALAAVQASLVSSNIYEPRKDRPVYRLSRGVAFGASWLLTGLAVTPIALFLA
jgi:hypothetical protein